jgi:hypothetical protein
MVRRRPRNISWWVIVLFGVITAGLLAPNTSAISPARAATDPLLVSLSHSAAPAGTAIEFNGKGFGAPRTTSFVTFSGVEAEVISWTDTRVEAIVPPKTVSGYAGITVDNVTSNGLWFAPSIRPIAYRLSSDVLPIGSRVTIYGKGFGTSQRTGWVTFSGVRAPIISWTDSQIVATVPPGTKTGYMGVWQNGACSNGLLFFAGERPVIGGLSSDVVFPGDTVTLTGRDFGSAAEGPDALTLAGQTVDFLAWSDTSITLKVPKGAKSGYVGVWRNGVSSNGGHLLVAPKVKSVSSSWGEPGTLVSISGSDFGSTPDRVTLGSTEMPVVSWSDDQIVVRVPDADEGYIGVWSGQACSNGCFFWPVRTPHVSGVTHGDGKLTVSGSGFGTNAPGSKVTLDATELDVVDWSDTRIVASVPAGAKGGFVGVWKRFLASNGQWVDLP